MIVKTIILRMWVTYRALFSFKVPKKSAIISFLEKLAPIFLFFFHCLLILFRYFIEQLHYLFISTMTPLSIISPGTAPVSSGTPPHIVLSLFSLSFSSLFPLFCCNSDSVEISTIYSSTYLIFSPVESPSTTHTSTESTHHSSYSTFKALKL